MTDNIEDDEYVASLLKQDAKSAKKKYELVGIDAFNPKSLKSGAPKLNTNFLRHIIRQTDSHNAALLAREAEESSARLKQMNRDHIRAHKKEEIRKGRKADGRLTPVMSEEEAHTRPPKRRLDHDENEGDHDSRHKRRQRSVDLQPRRHRSRSRDERRERRKYEDSDEEWSTRRKKRSEHHRDKHHSYEEGDRSRQKHKSGHKSRRHRSRSTSKYSRSPSPRTEQAERTRNYRDRDRSHSSKRPSRNHRSERASSKELYKSSKHKRRSPTPAADSDPLEAIIGPLPPHVQPSVRSRGRGAHKSNSMDMDSHFSATYDPAIDVRPPSDAEDNWGESVEAFRDRQRWKQQGADRLKAVGFTDDQVNKWGKDDHKDEEDVTWTKRGQAREWDRGKVVDEDGDVELKVEWGRLK